jgi:hypothetical protein
MRKGSVEVEETLTSEMELAFDFAAVPVLSIHEKSIGQTVQTLDPVLRLAETTHESPRRATECQVLAAADLPTRTHRRA